MNHLQSKVCKKTLRHLFRGKFRYKAVVNAKWKCAIYTSNELTFCSVSSTRAREMHKIHKRNSSSLDGLHSIFLKETVENDKEFEFTYFYNMTQYHNKTQTTKPIVVDLSETWINESSKRGCFNL